MKIHGVRSASRLTQQPMGFGEVTQIEGIGRPAPIVEENAELRSRCSAARTMYAVNKSPRRFREMPVVGSNPGPAAYARGHPAVERSGDRNQEVLCAGCSVRWVGQLKQNAVIAGVGIVMIVLGEKNRIGNAIRERLQRKVRAVPRYRGAYSQDIEAY